jgi:hypothetical protein
LLPELRKTSNLAETAFIEWAHQQGWELASNGWPDFLCSLGPDVVAVEVKDSKMPERQLSDEQRGVMRLLEHAGVKCYVWAPQTGLRRFGKQELI